jgi:hypothetical protein
MIKYLFDGYVLITAGGFMILAALSILWVKPQNKEAI